MDLKAIKARRAAITPGEWTAFDHADQQQARITELETVLGLYADPAAWLVAPDVRGGMGASQVNADRGTRARKALKGGE